MANSDMTCTPNQQTTQRIPLNDVLRQQIQDRFSIFKRKSNTDSSLRHAAVALTIIDNGTNEEASFLLTRRPKNLKRHGGQYALPGGRLDPNENAVEAALRELEEEIGINVPSDDVLGLMDDYQTRSGFNITPVVVWAGTRKRLYPDPKEVARTYRIPLSDLHSPDIPILESTTGNTQPVLSTPLASIGHQVYAPTAAFIYQFREIALFGRSTRVAQFDQPKFAWK